MSRMVPKTIMAMFINETIKESNSELMKNVLSGGNEKNLVRADKNKMAEVQQLEKELENLKLTMRALERL